MSQREAANAGVRQTDMNQIIVIHPYKYEGQWVFDDEAVGLRREAFVAGADKIIDKMVEIENIPNAAHGFTLLFSWLSGRVQMAGTGPWWQYVLQP
jgi:hypothetical protein